MDVKSSQFSAASRIGTAPPDLKTGEGSAGGAETRGLSPEPRDVEAFLAHSLAPAADAFDARLDAIVFTPPKPLAKRKAVALAPQRRKGREKAKRRTIRALAPVIVRPGQAILTAVLVQIDGDGRVVSSSARGAIVAAAIKELQHLAQSEAQAMAGEVVASLIQQHLQNGGV